MVKLLQLLIFLWLLGGFLVESKYIYKDLWVLPSVLFRNAALVDQSLPLLRQSLEDKLRLAKQSSGTFALIQRTHSKLTGLAVIADMGDMHWVFWRRDQGFLG